MAKNFRELEAKMSPERRARIQKRFEEEMRNMPLVELREARSLTQSSLANVLGVNQAAISKLERRADMYVSTLRSYIQAMGGDLEVRAVFPDGNVIITQFEDASETT